MKHTFTRENTLVMGIRLPPVTGAAHLPEDWAGHVHQETEIWGPCLNSADTPWVSISSSIF